MRSANHSTPLIPALGKHKQRELVIADIVD